MKMQFLRHLMNMFQCLANKHKKARNGEKKAMWIEELVWVIFRPIGICQSSRPSLLETIIIEPLV